MADETKPGMTRPTSADNENIDFVINYLKDKKEPFIIIYQISGDSLIKQMSAAGLCQHQIVDALEMMLDGMKGDVEPVDLDS